MAHADAPSPKRAKVSGACDVCRTKKIKCDGVQPECGPCRTRSHKGVRCNWESVISRTGALPLAQQDELVRLRQRLRELESQDHPPGGDSSSGQTLESPVIAPQLQNSAIRQDHTGTQQSSMRAPELHQSPGHDRTSGQLRRRPTASNDEQSPASAMVGSVDRADKTQGFYGTSSAGNFMTHVRRLVAKRSGQDLASSPRSSDSDEIWDGNTPGLNLNIDEYALPPRTRADALISVYWDIVHPLYPFIDKVTMMAQYDSLFSGRGSDHFRPALLCKLYVIFALSCRLDTTTTPESRRSSANVFFHRAQSCLDLWQLEASLSSIQILLLLSQYLQSTDRPYLCWSFVGTAIRMAQSMGLHLLQTTRQVSSAKRRDTMRRIWHSCILMDRILAMTYGRPAMISRAIASLVPLPISTSEEDLGMSESSSLGRPSPSRLDFFTQSLKLYDIVDQLLDQSYSGLGEPSAAGGSETPVRSSIHASLLEMDAKLMGWEANLPVHLREAHRVAAGQYAHFNNRDNILLRQGLVLRQRFLHVRLLCLRPILSAHLMGDTTTSTADLGTNLMKRMTTQSAIVCVKVAQETIELVHTHRASDWSTTGMLAAWWYNVLFVYSAATVLVAAKLCDLPEHEVSVQSTEESWHRAMAVLEGLKEYSDSIPTLIASLLVIHAELPSRYSQYRENHSAGQNLEHTQPTRSHAGRHYENMRQHQQLLHENVLDGHSAGAPPMHMHHGFEMAADSDAGLWFYPEDMSWLNTVPIDM